MRKQIPTAQDISIFTINIAIIIIFPPMVLYLAVVEWLACLRDPESYADGSIAADRVTHVGQVKGDKPDEKSTLVERVTIFHCKNITVKKCGHEFFWGKIFRS